MNENQNIEWKESWRDEYLKWICGFANATGGKIYIGMNDSGKVVGVADAEKLLGNYPDTADTLRPYECVVLKRSTPPVSSEKILTC